MKGVKNSERFQVPKSMPGDLADQLSLLIHLHKQKVTIERLPSSNLKKHLIGRINELLDTTATPKEQREYQATLERLETIKRLQNEVTDLKTKLASAEDQIANATDNPPVLNQGFGFFSLLLASLVGYLLAWLSFG
jgi:predicted  nucleic acid-binding Zn-ribbon protein